MLIAHTDILKLKELVNEVTANKDIRIAKITTEGRTAIIKGTKKIQGAKVKSTDLRGGAAMVIAGLVANRNNGG